jgi:hypothetical protein
MTDTLFGNLTTLAAADITASDYSLVLDTSDLTGDATGTVKKTPALGFNRPTVYLVMRSNTIDTSGAGTLIFDTMYPDTAHQQNGDEITDIPEGLGIDFELDTDGVFTTTEAGFWHYKLSVYFTPDATGSGYSGITPVDLIDFYTGPDCTSASWSFFGAVPAGGSSSLALDAAVTFSAFANDIAAPTTTPWEITPNNASIEFVRLA